MFKVGSPIFEYWLCNNELPTMLTPDSVSIVGNSLLHNQYSNIGDPTLNTPAYSNFGAGAMGYANPPVSALGQATQAYQEPVNRYSANAPEERSF